MSARAFLSAVNPCFAAGRRGPMAEFSGAALLQVQHRARHRAQTCTDVPNSPFRAAGSVWKSQVPKPTSEQIFSTLTEVLRDVFDNDDLVATPELDATQVEGWDSMGNVRLFLAIEQAMGVRFGAGEISEIHNVGELVGRIARKV